MHLLHKKCGSHVRNQMFCRLCKVVVERADLVRRFEVSKGKYVQVTEEELQSVEVRRITELSSASPVVTSRAAIIWHRQ